MRNTMDEAKKQGHSVWSFYSKWKNDDAVYDDCFPFGSYFEHSIHIVLARLTGFNGCFTYFATKRLISKLKRIQPDIIHLHNLHFWSINLPLLFSYIKKHKIKTVWTLHDCWAFTGQCPHFAMAKCDKWKTGCGNCPQYRCYPESYVDRTKTMYKLKKKWFTGVSDMTIVTPSQWLCDLVKQSYLKDYPVKVINNGIDLNVFKPTESDFRAKYGLEDKYIVLGVASPWSERKGLDVFIELAKRLDDKYKIVLVGLSKEQNEGMPKNIIGIERTHNQTELAEIYSAADVFANPTREETFPTVNIESIACGTPVVTFDTGGSAEILDATCGSVVDCDDITALQSEVENICVGKLYGSDACINRAGYFDKNEKFMEYVKIY